MRPEPTRTYDSEALMFIGQAALEAQEDVAMQVARHLHLTAQLHRTPMGSVQMNVNGTLIATVSAEWISSPGDAVQQFVVGVTFPGAYVPGSPNSLRIGRMDVHRGTGETRWEENAYTINSGLEQVRQHLNRAA